LLKREAASEVALDRRERDVDDGRVDEDDDGPEDASDEDEAVAGLRRQVFDTRRTGGGARLSDYQIVSLDDVPDWLGDYPGEMRGITYPIGAEQVALTYRRMPQHTGSKGFYGHRHKTQEELYFVISGKLQFKLGDEIVEVGEHHAVRVPPDTVRGVWNDEPEDAELIIVSMRIDDPQGDAETVEGFWPA
jgi:mannose-6-phosphate isomerase-like protein (cupin superfamily)